MNIVLDTNVLVSAVVFGGLPSKLIDLTYDGTIVFYISPFILDETERVLKKKFHWNEVKTAVTIRFLKLRSSVVIPDYEVTEVQSDPTDNAILSCALAAKADYIITGDSRHLIPIKKFRGIRIMTPAQFFREVMYSEE